MPDRVEKPVFVPVPVPRRIFESFPPAVRSFIERRIQHGEAIIVEGD